MVSVVTGSPVSVSRTQIRSGVVASGSPSRSASRYSFWKDRRNSVPVPAMVAVPRAKPPVVARCTSTTFPVARRTPSTSAATASAGSVFAARAVRTAAPSRCASVIVPATRPSGSCAPVIIVSAVNTEHPVATHAARAIRSAHRFDAVRSTIVLPLSSATAIGLVGMPASVGSTICASGNARPIASPSTTGSPVSAASASGISEFIPPISIGTTWVAATPVASSSARSAVSVSVPLGSFSWLTVGAPSIATGTTTASGGTSSIVTTVTGPCRVIAASARSLLRYGPRPPPVPRMPAPRAMSSTSENPISRTGHSHRNPVQIQVADCLHPYPGRAARQVRERHLVDLHDLDAARPGAGRLRAGDRLRPRLGQHGGAGVVRHPDDPVQLTADLRDRRADRVRDGRVGRAPHVGQAGQHIRQYYAAAADQHD